MAGDQEVFCQWTDARGDHFGEEDDDDDDEEEEEEEEEDGQVVKLRGEWKPTSSSNVANATAGSVKLKEGVTFAAALENAHLGEKNWATNVHLNGVEWIWDSSLPRFGKPPKDERRQKGRAVPKK
jgi:hypothetical protein